jgi:NAD(P)H-quinone oxidoreductase subunit 5
MAWLLALLLLDPLAWLMLMLVSFVGWMVARFSLRYLAGEAHRDRYFCWLGFTICAVGLMAISDHLALLLGAWIAASLGLHQLLTHYGDRPAARDAAWMKFGVSRLGDVLLLIGIVLISRELGTLSLSQIYEQSTLLASAEGPSRAALATIAWLLVLGAAIKTAQFPFGFWLPATMEAPTPVSALMHAGIVNAGGYFLIRTSPLLAASPEALATLAIVGAATALLGGLVMLTQSSVKQALAYSTIAQMGFMMLQCGLGAYSAAMLHLIAHSLYKAYAFLASGDVLVTSRAAAPLAPVGVPSARPTLHLLSAIGAAGGCFFTAMGVMGISIEAKPGGWLLGGVVCLALVRWLVPLFGSGSFRLAAAGVATAAGLSLVYAVSFRAVDGVLRASSPELPVVQLGMFTVLLGWGGLLLLLIWERNLASRPGSRFRDALYVHASNGFYLDAIARRWGRALSS